VYRDANTNTCQDVPKLEKKKPHIMNTSSMA